MNIHSENRATVIVIFSKWADKNSFIRDMPCIHFSDTPLAGSNHNVWFPIPGKDIFQEIELIVTINNIVHHVVVLNPYVSARALLITK